MSTWSHLLDLSQQLRSGELAPQQALAQPLPAPLLHHYACDCAEHGLLFLRSQLGEPPKECFQALAVKRAWIEGLAVERDVQRALSLVEAIAPTAYTPGNLTQELDRYATFATSEALSSEPRRASLEILRCMSECLSTFAKDAITWEKQADRQMVWERLHLASLVQAFVATRSQLLRSLLQRKGQLGTTLGSFQMAMEDVLY